MKIFPTLYLICRTLGNSDEKADMLQRMNIATAKSVNLNKIWKNHRLTSKIENVLYIKSVSMVFAHMVNGNTDPELNNGFKSR